MTAISGDRARWVAAVVLAWATASPAALVEIPAPVGLSEHDVGLRMLAANPSKPRYAHRLLDTHGNVADLRYPAMTAGAGMLRTAETGIQAARAPAAVTGFEFLLQADAAGMPWPSETEKSIQKPELWTLILLGAGLVVYQLRRQSRIDRRVIKISS